MAEKKQMTRETDTGYYRNEIIYNIHTFYLSGEIKEPELYSEWLNIIRNSAPSDFIKLYINSSGGVLDTTLQIVQALRESEAYIITSIEGICASAATLIFLQGNEFVVAPNSTFMLHTYSGGTVGKGNEMRAQSTFEENWADKLFRSSYYGFLADEEINNVLNGNDMWMGAEEVTLRCELLTEFREKENGKIKENK